MDESREFSTGEQRIFDRARQAGVPVNGSFELTPLCNMNCRMCYVRLDRKAMEAQGRLLTGAQWLAVGRQAAEAGTMFLLLTGGEPLLHPDFREIYLGLKAMGMVLTINTNGTLIDEEWADFFAAHRPRRINITLYGKDEKAYETLCRHPGGFEKVLRGVRLLRERGVDVKLAGSATPENGEDIPAMYQVARELDVPLHTDCYMMNARRERPEEFHYESRLAPEEAAEKNLTALRLSLGEDFYSQYRTQALARVDGFQKPQEAPCAISCNGGLCSYTVNWQGHMRLCVVMTEPEVDLTREPFAKGWQAVHRAAEAIRFCRECSVCPRRHLCRVCAAACLLETGDYMGKPEYLCRYAQATEDILRREEADHG